MLLVLLNCLTESTFPSPRSYSNRIQPSYYYYKNKKNRGGGGGGGGGRLKLRGRLKGGGGGGKIAGPPPISMKPCIYTTPIVVQIVEARPLKAEICKGGGGLLAFGRFTTPPRQ